MKLPKIFICFCTILLLNISYVHAQNRILEIETHLTDLSARVPELNDTVNISVNEDLGLFLRAIAKQAEININIAQDVTQQLNNNFSHITIKEILVFLCKEYNLDIEITGSIISVKNYTVVDNNQINNNLKIIYNDTLKTISLDIKNQDLATVAKQLTSMTGYNLVIAPGLENKKITIYVKNLEFQKAIENIGFAHSMDVLKGENGIYYFSLKNTQNNNDNGFVPTVNLNNSNFSVNDSLITIDVTNVSIMDLLKQVSYGLEESYFLYSDLTGTVTLNVHDITYETFLKHLLIANNFNYKKDGDVYIIGNKDLKYLNSSRVIKLQYRSIDKVLEQIPSKIRDGIDVTSFIESNSFLVSGDEPRILDFENFIRSIDQAVPVVMIEMFIIDFSDTRTVSAGIEGGLSNKPVATQGTVLGGLDVTLGSSSVNSVFDALSSNGIINLGHVAPNFYLTIQALESDGILRTRSNPRLSTLNGHMAEITLGNKEYYLQITNNTVGAQVPQVIATEQYIPIEANFNVQVTPFVSEDEQVTMDINVTQSDFTERASPTAPPGTVTRSFKSLIRVKDQEMVLLGGLEELKTTETGKGFPFLNRIPGLNWILGKRSKTNNKSKLLLLIKPTVFY